MRSCWWQPPLPNLNPFVKFLGDVGDSPLALNLFGKYNMRVRSSSDPFVGSRYFGTSFVVKTCVIVCFTMSISPEPHPRVTFGSVLFLFLNSPLDHGP